MIAESLLRTTRLASGFKGPFFLLSGFFDGTACPDDPKFSGVAGYLFDDDGLARYRAGASAVRDRLNADLGLSFNVLHATSCCGSRRYEEFRDWPGEVRQRICREMAKLAADTRLAGFVTLAQQSEFEALDTNIAAKLAGLYPATLLAGIERVSWFAKQRNERVFYWLEQGDPKQAVANDVLNKISSDERLRERFAYFSHAIVPKNHSEAVALVAADQLAWECKRNFKVLYNLASNDKHHDDEQLSECFKLLRGDEPDRWFETHLSEGALSVQLIIKMFYGLP